MKINKVCNNCGAHHECIIGNYYQPTCDCGDKKINKELTDFIYGDGRLDEEVVWGQSPFVPNKKYSHVEEESTDEMMQPYINSTSDNYGGYYTVRLLPGGSCTLSTKRLDIENISTNKVYTVDVYCDVEQIPSTTLDYFTVEAITFMVDKDFRVANRGFTDAYIVIKDRIEI